MVVRRIPGAATTLVWIHGLGEQAASWDFIAREIHGPTHVLPDLPGYGRSVPGAWFASLAARAEALVAWLGAQPPVVLVGHSLGGVLATLIAERMQVRGVINVDGNLTRGDCTFSARALAEGPAVFRDRGFAAMRDELLASTDPALRGYGLAISQTSSATFYADAEDLVRMSSADDLAPRFAALACPTLFIAGLPGGICARSQQQLAALGVPVASITPSGHWPFIDQPAAFATAVTRFLAAL